MTLEPSQPTFFDGMELPLMSSRAASRAKTFQQAGNKGALPPNAAASTQRLFASLANLDPNSFAWKTSQTFLSENGEIGLQPFCGTWPASGMTRNGSSFRRIGWERHTLEPVSGLLPTPTKSDATAWHSDLIRFDSLSVELRKRFGHPSYPHPRFVEWMMGFPIGWTDLQHSETQSSPKSPN